MQEVNQLKHKPIHKNIQRLFLNSKRFNKEDSKMQNEKINRQYQEYLLKQEHLTQEFTKQLQDEFIDFLEDNYILFNKEEIIDFIFNEHPNLKDFLYDVTPLVEREYPNNKLMLMYITDYDSPDLNCIMLFVLSDLNKNDFLDLNDKLLTFKINLKNLKEFHDVDWEFDMGVASDDSI